MPLWLRGPEQAGYQGDPAGVAYRAPSTMRTIPALIWIKGKDGKLSIYAPANAEAKAWLENTTPANDQLPMDFGLFATKEAA